MGGGWEKKRARRGEEEGRKKARRRERGAEWVRGHDGSAVIYGGDSQVVEAWMEITMD